jgi:outer membrane protein assembly factor BamB
MMLKFTRQVVYVLVLSLLLSGCFWDKKTKTKVDPLPKIDQEISFNTVWKATGGTGPSKLLFNLAPALTSIEGETALVTADAKGYVIAINATTGKRLWKVDTNLPLSSAVGYTDNLIVLGSHKADLVALDKVTGEEKWRTKTSTEVFAGPMGRDSGIALLTIDSRLHGIDPATGNQKWIFDANAPALKLRGGSTPLVFDDVALVGFASGQAGLFDLNTGRVIWFETIAQPRGRTEIERIVDINGRLARRGNMAYIVTFQGKVVALDLSNLQIVWSRDSSSYTGLDAGVSTLVVSDTSGTLHAFNRVTGETLWTQEALINRKPTAPAIVKDYVVVGDEGGRVYAFSLETGKLLGHRRIEGSGILAAPLVDNQDVIIQTKSGRVIKLTLDNN